MSIQRNLRQKILSPVCLREEIIKGLGQKSDFHLVQSEARMYIHEYTMGKSRQGSRRGRDEKRESNVYTRSRRVGICGVSLIKRSEKR